MMTSIRTTSNRWRSCKKLPYLYVRKVSSPPHKAKSASPPARKSPHLKVYPYFDRQSWPRRRQQQLVKRTDSTFSAFKTGVAAVVVVTMQDRSAASASTLFPRWIWRQRASERALMGGRKYNLCTALSIMPPNTVLYSNCNLI